MAVNRFPGPRMSELLEQTEQDDIDLYQLDYSDIGARVSGLPRAITNKMTVRNIGSSMGPGRNPAKQWS